MAFYVWLSNSQNQGNREYWSAPPHRVAEKAVQIISAEALHTCALVISSAWRKTLALLSQKVVVNLFFSLKIVGYCLRHIARG